MPKPVSRTVAAVAVTVLLVLAGLAGSVAGAQASAADPDPGTVVAGNQHTCALTTSGAADCWGDDTFGQATDQPGPYSQLAAGQNHTCGLTGSGAADCWGDDTFDQNADKPGPFTQLAAGGFHTCGLTGSGAANCWGQDTDGQSATQPGPFTQLAAGGFHTCGLTPSGAADCWGQDTDGQAADQAGPFTQLAAGFRHTCGLTTSGAADCWGDNSSGQATDHAGPYTQLVAGGTHTCGLTTSGAADCWGGNDVGQATDQTGPFTQLAAGYRHTCGLTASGAVDCWGANDSGQATDQSGPYAVGGGGSYDTTAPRVTSSVTGHKGLDGWYVGDVTLTWTVTEPDSPDSVVRTGCVDRTITQDQGATTYTCTARSDGGTSPVASVTVKRDATAPSLSPTAPEQVLLGSGPVTVDPGASDATSGVRSADCATGSSGTAGLRTVSCKATDRAGNRSRTDATYLVEYVISDVRASGTDARQRWTARAAGSSLSFRLTDARGRAVPDAEAQRLLRQGRVTVTGEGPARGRSDRARGRSLSYDARAHRFVLHGRPEGGPLRITVTYAGTSRSTSASALRA